jgi:hypothetical protein
VDDLEEAEFPLVAESERGGTALTELDRRAIRLRTEIPGPKSRAFLERRRAVVSRAIGEGIPICVQSARGSTITDVDGNTFIDFAGGIGVLNVGHTPATRVKSISTSGHKYGLAPPGCGWIIWRDAAALPEELVFHH